MRKLSEEYRDEAKRLLSLSTEEVEVEGLALALRIGVESEEAAAELQNIDEAFLQHANPTQGDTSFEVS